MITPEMIEKLKAQYSGDLKERNQTVSELINDIKENHHEKELKMIDSLLVDIKFYENNVNTIKENYKDVFGFFRHMAYDLKNHFEKEEYIVFPMMINKYSNQAAGYNEDDENAKLMLKINELESEHAKTEEFIADIERTTDNYSHNPEDVELGNIFDKMQELFADISQHEGKENGELFARFL